MYTQVHWGKKFHYFYNVVVNGVNGRHTDEPNFGSSVPLRNTFEEVLSTQMAPQTSQPDPQNYASKVLHFLLKLLEWLPL